MFRKKENEPTSPTAPATQAAPAPLPTRGAAQTGQAAPSGQAAASTSAVAPNPNPAPAAAPASGTSSRAAEPSAGKRLIVGEGLSLSGDITACDLLVVEGSVRVTLNETRAIEIAETGRFTNGKAAVEEATISGVYEGELTVRGRLLVRGTGRVDGAIRYGELEVERGGRLSGSIEILDEPAAASPAPVSPQPTTAKPATPAPATPEPAWTSAGES